MPIQVQADCTNFLGGSAIGNHNSNHNSNSKEGRKNPLYSFLNSFRFPYNSNPPHFVNSNPSQNPTYSIPSQPHKSINEQLSSNLKFMNYFPQKTSSHSNFNHVPSAQTSNGYPSNIPYPTSHGYTGYRNPQYPSPHGHTGGGIPPCLSSKFRLLGNLFAYFFDPSLVCSTRGEFQTNFI